MSTYNPGDDLGELAEVVYELSQPMDEGCVVCGSVAEMYYYSKDEFSEFRCTECWEVGEE